MPATIEFIEFNDIDVMAGRMLLSHNFNLSPDLLPPLSRADFAALFRSTNLPLRVLDHPHWWLEIRFDAPPESIAQQCAQAWVQVRPPRSHALLILGGLKTTPPTSDHPQALQSGEWGVDVVETESGAAFLQAIHWDTTIATKPPDTIFKVECKADG